MTETTAQIGCIGAATAILGDKWTPHLLRAFLNEDTVRFCQLQDLVEGLDSLESRDIITKNATPSSSRCEYRLTQKGKELLPILQQMDQWSTRHATV